MKIPNQSRSVLKKASSRQELMRMEMKIKHMFTYVHALVVSRLDHCNALYVGLPLRLLRKLQVVQNAAARLLSGVRRCQHISPTLAALHSDSASISKC